ncbi:formate--tetrahydrofolate ligase [Candidatus Sordicultor fermentans]|jgi:formate--tetrahydrofolate ligase|uniref:formate--tetrahydrofolate ligase n=1 Tax=Candidatus Sordicultor fermentans TaxID=1953203 RepID=UPI00169C5C84|nr:formate--tetrahydrofolate ligase [Candidatus Atribacteria bacterium]HOA98622.1 formate--tetrahydrofolate ligase [Candidatus Atribacteria bacterium]HPZ39224.1 formate--tetrahydrofolate ligase [Candidatus Atribacteria bacterium]
MLSDLEIAQKAQMKPITEIAQSLGLSSDDIDLYGKYKAKVSLEVLENFSEKPQSKYIDVTAITPTPLGEGKTVTTIGLSQALNKIGKKSIVCIRQPSLGPVFGIKGGAAGGGYSQVVPMEDFNLHLTGDTHAVAAANNLLAAFIDNHLHHGNKLNIDPFTISWPRVVDISDRALRKIVIGLGGKTNGVPRESSFDIAVASEVMAILALTTDIFDLRARLGRIVIGYNKDKKPVTAEDLQCAGAMTVLMKEAIKPNLLQTLENTPCFVHAGPFANIAHGNSSIIADQIALRLSDYVVTESGFGADCGMEKFMDIKCRYSGLIPSCVVMVTSIRALKMHSGKYKVVAGRPLDPGLTSEDVEAVEKGSENMIKQIENARLFGVPVVVTINLFASDTDREVETVRRIALENGAFAAEVSEVWEKGGEGGRNLAEAVVRACDEPQDFRFLYPLDIPIKEKIEIIATKIYGADGVIYEPKAEEGIKRFTDLGWDKLPICMAKTHLSLSHDPKLKGRPRGFKLPIRDIRPSIGAGFLYPLCGEMSTMPGLPSEPAGNKVDIDHQGRVVGLF